MTAWGDSVKDKVKLLDVVEKVLGDPKRESGGWKFWLCPFHTEKTPSFGVKDDNYHCFGCDVSGDVITWFIEYGGLSYEEIDLKVGGVEVDSEEARLRRLERETRELKRKQEEHERRLSALERIHNCTDHIRYHETMPEEAFYYWNTQGMMQETIERYKLGYCHRCQTDKDGRPSYTIPVMSNGKLWNIRHRLLGAGNGDKYRPHMSGLPTVLFNADDLRAGSHTILIVEGEKKSIIASQEGFCNVGIMGATSFNTVWVPKFSMFSRVCVCLDPDATKKASEIAQLFNGRGRLVVLPEKLDDLIVQYGATARDIAGFIELGRKV